MKKVALMAVAFSAVVLVSASAFAASPLRAVGVEAGYVSPDLEGVENADGTWVAGLFLDFGLPMQNMYINPFVNYWNWSDGSGTEELSFSDWAIGANLKWAIPTAGKVQPFLAAGACAHMLNASQESISLDEGETKYGFQTGAGVKIGVSQSASLMGSGWYSMVEDANHWSMRAGLSFSI
jgi:opacity protein-like surface antigen